MSQIRPGRLCVLTCIALLTAWLPARAETLTLFWDPNPEPTVVGYVVYIGPGMGSYTERIDVGAATHYDFTAAPGTTHCFAVAAYSGGSMEGDRSREVCAAGNAAPTLANPGDQTSPIGQVLSLSLSGVDPEGAPLTYTVTGLPAGLTVMQATGIISGTPTQSGSTTVNATVSDGQSSATVSFGWTVTGSAPGAATLLRPSGTISTTSPTFEWASVPTATRYRLWVNAGVTSQQTVRDLTPAEAGCTGAGASICRATTGVTLVTGPGSWSVRATNAYGDGPWAGAMDFTLPGNQGPTVTITTPTNAATYSVGTATIALSGTATDDLAVTQVTWATDKGAAGTAAGTSTWSVPQIALQPGANVITVTARDANNNTATDVLTVTFADSQAPTVSITAQPAAAGPSVNSSVTVTGTAVDNVGVTEVRWSNSQGGSGVATGTTNWSTGPITLKLGANVITVTARDAAGNTGTGVVTLTLADGLAPTIDIAQPTAAATYSTTSPTIGLGGVATDNIGVTEVRWSNSQGGSGVASGTSTWSAGALTLKAGTNVITVTARDAAGNMATDTLTVIVTDNVAPTVAITRPGSLSTTAATAVLTGTAADAFGVEQVAWSNSRGGSGVASGTTSWTVAGIPIQMGANIITITARDAAGLVGTDMVTVTRTDGDAPTVSLLTPTTGGTYSTTSRTLALTGVSADAVGVSQVTWANSRGGSGTAAGTASWAVQGVVLQLGANVITVTARDAAGNAGQAVLSVTATDGEPPTVAIVTPVGSPTFSTGASTVALAGTANDATGVTAVTWSNSQGGNGSAVGTSSWSVPAVALVPGVNVITIAARDSAGNEGRAQLTITVTDTRAPVITILTNSASATSRTISGATQTVDLVGSAGDDFGLASVSWRNSRGGSGVATGTTSWTATGIPIVQGSNEITVIATDKAGNTAVATTKLNGSKVEKTVTVPAVTTPVPATVTGSTTPTTYIAPTPIATPVAPPIVPSTVPTGQSPDGSKDSPQTLPPQLAIQMPDTNGRWTTSASTVPLEGTATDNVTRVTWKADWGGSGTASGTRAWTVATVGLQIGKNLVTVTATTADGRTASQTVTIWYTPLRATR